MNKKIIGASAVAIMGAMGMSAPALAQNSSSMSSFSGGQSTNAAPSRDISISAFAQVRHDSNVARTSAAQAAARGLSRSDDKFSPGVNVNVALPFGAHSFTLSGNASYDFHRQNKRLDRERIQFGSSLGMNLPICDPSLSATFSRRQSDLGDIGAVPGVTPTSVSNVETTKAFGGTVACGKDYGLRPTVSIGYEEGRNSGIQRRITNRNILTYAGGLGYVHPSIGDILLFVQQRDTRFPNQLLSDGRENGHRLRNYGVRFKRNIGSRLQGSVEVTYAELNSRQVNVKNFHGLNWAADLTAQVTPRMVMQGSVSRSISSALSVDANYHVNTHYGLDATYAVTPLINVQGGFSISPRRFYGTQAIPLPGVPTPQQLIRDRQNTFFGSVSYQFSPKLRFIFEGAHEKRSANGTFFDYSNNRLGLRAELSL